MSLENKEKIKTFMVDILYDFVGSVLFALAVNIFTAPNEIAPGGVTGLATMLNSITGLKIGTLSFLINIPLIILGLCFLGKKFILKTFRTLIVLTIVLDVSEMFLPTYTDNMILASIFGGVLLGAGLGVIFMRGSTTGGTDILGRVLLLKFPHIPLGKLLMVVDCIVITFAGFYYGSLEAALYALVSIYATERALDEVLYGRGSGRIVYIISDKYEEIADYIMNTLERGVTYLNGEGGYTGENKHVIVCALPDIEFSKLKKQILGIDPLAFLMVAPSSHIIGEGFKPAFDDM